MSELIQTRKTLRTVQWELLTTVSAFALLAICGANGARAEEADRPAMWVELGGQLEHVDGGEQPYTPAFLSPVPSFIVQSPLNIERPARYSYGAEGKISFVPKDTDWAFSIALRYSRSMANRHVHEETPGATVVLPNGVTHHLYHVNRTDTVVRNNESHAILDFQAGKDVGLGVFGRESISTLNFGVRYAQFGSHSSDRLQMASGALAGSYTFFQYLQLAVVHGITQQSHAASALIEHSFRGVGPTISWNASAPFVGGAGETEFSFDWGLNAAILFGRQKTSVHHQSILEFYSHRLPHAPVYTTTALPSVDKARARSVVVPNLGGFAGLSLKFPNAKISVGYRADFFFGAMDGGIDSRQTYDRAFYGPFATVSIGLP